MAEKETQIGRAKMKQAPQKPISFKLKDKSVKAKHLDDKSVTEEKLDDNSVSTRTISNESVTESKMHDNSISTRTLRENSVTHDKIHDNAVKARNINEKEIGWQKLNDDLKNIISTSAGQHGIPLSTEFGDSNILGITQKTLSEAIGDVHKEGEAYIPLQMQIDQIVNDKAAVSLTANKAAVFVGVETGVILTASTNTTASAITISKEGTQIATGQGTTLTANDTVNPASHGNINYAALFVISGLSKIATRVIQAVDAVYTGSAATYGAATMAAESTPHAAGSFNKQITTAAGDHIFIEVPDYFSLTGLSLVSTYETALSFTQIESAREGYKAYMNTEERGAGSYTYKITIAND